MRWVIEYDCGKSIYMDDAFLLYYWGGDDYCYYLTKGKQTAMLKY